MSEPSQRPAMWNGDPAFVFQQKKTRIRLAISALMLAFGLVGWLTKPSILSVMAGLMGAVYVASVLIVYGALSAFAASRRRAATRKSVE